MIIHDDIRTLQGLEISLIVLFCKSAFELDVDYEEHVYISFHNDKLVIAKNEEDGSGTLVSDGDTVWFRPPWNGEDIEISQKDALEAVRDFFQGGIEKLGLALLKTC